MEEDVNEAVQRKEELAWSKPKPKTGFKAVYASTSTLTHKLFGMKSAILFHEFKIL